MTAVETEDARAALAAKLGVSPVDVDAMVREIASDVMGRLGVTSKVADPDQADCLNALRLVDERRVMAEYEERMLIHGARRFGATWHQIGEALGYPAATAAQRAQKRWKYLAPYDPYPVRELTEQTSSNDNGGQQT